MATNGRKPKVFLCSTSYDLEDFRALIVDRLGSEFEFIFFEDAAFAARRGLHSHDQCIAAVAEADIVVCIIDSRYGGKYHGKQPTRFKDQTIEVKYKTASGQPKTVNVVTPTKELSITWCELIEAYDRSLQVMTFARQRTLDEKQTRRKNQGNKSYIPAHVDSVKVFDLLDWITKQDKDNWITSFTNAVDLLEKISKWLRSASNTMVIPAQPVSGPKPPIITLVEGNRDVDIARTIVSQLGLKRPVEFIVTQGKYSMLNGLPQYIEAFKDASGIIILLDADTDDQSEIERERDLLFARIPKEHARKVRIVQAVPQLDEWLFAIEKKSKHPPSKEHLRLWTHQSTRRGKLRLDSTEIDLQRGLEMSPSLRLFVSALIEFDSTPDSSEKSEH